MADIKGLLADPQFNALDAQTQRAALGRVDPAFNSLSDADYQAFRTRVSAPGPDAQGGEKTGFLGRLGSVASGMGHMIAHPWESAKQLASPNPNWQAQGREQIAQGHPGQALLTEASALPVVGPAIGQAAQDIQNKDWGAVGADAALAALPFVPKGLRAAGKIPAVATASRAAGGVVRGVAEAGADLHSFAAAPFKLTKGAIEGAREAINPGPIAGQAMPAWRGPSLRPGAAAEESNIARSMGKEIAARVNPARGGDVSITLPEGTPAEYGQVGGAFGEKMAADAFAKDTAIAKHLQGRGITPEAFDAANADQLNQWAKDAGYRRGINPARVQHLRNRLFSGPTTGSTGQY